MFAFNHNEPQMRFPLYRPPQPNFPYGTWLLTAVIVIALICFPSSCANKDAEKFVVSSKGNSDYAVIRIGTHQYLTNAEGGSGSQSAVLCHYEDCDNPKHLRECLCDSSDIPKP